MRVSFRTSWMAGPHIVRKILHKIRATSEPIHIPFFSRTSVFNELVPSLTSRTLGFPRECLSSALHQFQKWKGLFFDDGLNDLYETCVCNLIVHLLYIHRESRCCEVSFFLKNEYHMFWVLYSESVITCMLESCWIKNLDAQACQVVCSEKLDRKKNSFFMSLGRKH